LDWYQSWPDIALKSVSYKKLQELELPDDKIRKNLAEICKVIHLTST
jgi:hypothetical protein